MSDEKQIEALRSQHQSLKTVLDEEMHRPSPDSIKIKELKQQKLRIKDKIAALEAHA